LIAIMIFHVASNTIPKSVMFLKFYLLQIDGNSCYGDDDCSFKLEISSIFIHGYNLIVYCTMYVIHLVCNFYKKKND
jgi:hypothetical protein